MGDNRAASEYVLIDFENVQPKNLELLKKHPFKVFVFCGAHQARIPLALASRMQELGTNARYVEMSGNGRNALDFHIAFYLGELAAADPEAQFHIISRDTGFDPLIRHLRDRHIRVQRENDLAEIPVLRMAGTPSRSEQIDSIVRNLKGRGQARPRKVKTLANTINSLFTKKLEDSELLSLIEELKERWYISVNEGNVSYQLGNEKRREANWKAPSKLGRGTTARKLSRGELRNKIASGIVLETEDQSSMVPNNKTSIVDQLR